MEEEIELQEAQLVFCEFWTGVGQRGRTARDRELVVYWTDEYAKHQQKKSEAIAALAAMKNP